MCLTLIMCLALVHAIVFSNVFAVCRGRERLLIIWQSFIPFQNVSPACVKTTWGLLLGSHTARQPESFSWKAGGCCCRCRASHCQQLDQCNRRVCGMMWWHHTRGSSLQLCSQLVCRASCCNPLHWCLQTQNLMIDSRACLTDVWACQGQRR